jgi:two-component sensor histidine kinase
MSDTQYLALDQQMQEGRAYIRLLIVLTIIIVFSVAGLISNIEQHKLESIEASQWEISYPILTMAHIESEYWQFHLALNNYVTSSGQITQDEYLNQLDQLWQRIYQFNKHFKAWNELSESRPDISAIASLMQVLAEDGSRLVNLKPGNISFLNEFLLTIKEYDISSRIDKTTLDTEKNAAKFYKEIIKKKRDHFSIITIYMALTLLACLAFIYLLNRRRLHNRDLAFEAIETHIYLLNRRRLHNRDLAFEAIETQRAMRQVKAISDQKSLELKQANLELESREQQKSLLIREVHHHIKNHLQGVGGLLSQQASANPSIATILQGAISQISAISIIHGLQADEAREELAIADLVLSIFKSTQGFRSAPMTLVNLTDRTIMLGQNEGVPVALILNELLMNAIKHNTNNTEIKMNCIIVEKNHIEIEIINSAPPLPDSFNFNTSQALGTGLSLVRSLMPPKGANLEIVWLEGLIYTKLTLIHPVIHC